MCHHWIHPQTFEEATETEAGDPPESEDDAEETVTPSRIVVG